MIEKSTRPIKQKTEEEVVTLSKDEFAHIMAKHSSHVIHDIIPLEDEDDAQMRLMLLMLMARITAEVVSSIFDEEEN